MLKFSSEILRVRMAQEKFRQGLGIRRHIELFVGADSRIGASRDIADGVPAGFTGRDPSGRQSAHHAGGVVNVDVMKLNILPGRNVRDSIGIFFGQVRQCLKLSSVEPASGNLDALHARGIPQRTGALRQRTRRIFDLLYFLAVVALAVVIPLAVGSSAQPRFRKQSLIHLALFSQGDVRFKVVNFTGQRLRNPSGEAFRPKRIRDLHSLPASAM